MTKFAAFGWTQYAISQQARFNAALALALDVVAQVEQWEVEAPRKLKAECVSDIKRALVLAKTPTSSVTKFVGTIDGLVLRLAKEYKPTLTQVRAAVTDADSKETTESAVAMLATVLAADGVTGSELLAIYARKGKPGIAAALAEAEAKVAEAVAREAMTEAEAKAAAEAEAAEAEAAKAEQSPRGKATKQAAAILASLAKHGEYMSDAELDAIAAAIGETLAKRKALELEAQVLRDQAAAKAVAAEIKRAA